MSRSGLVAIRFSECPARRQVRERVYALQDAAQPGAAPPGEVVQHDDERTLAVDRDVPGRAPACDDDRIGKRRAPLKIDRHDVFGFVVVE